MSLVEAGVAELKRKQPKWWQFWKYRNSVSPNYIPDIL